MAQGARHGWLPRILLLGASILVVLVAAELFLRALPDSTLGFNYKKDRFRLPQEFQLNLTPNSLGYHDVEPPPRRAGVRRVLLLGDSFVESYSVPVPQAVGRRLEHHLNESSRVPFDVVAIGKSGWGQRDELEALRELGKRLAPDVVLTLFLPLNDVQNNSPALRARAKAQVVDSELMFRPGWTRRHAATMPFFYFRWSVLNQLVSHRIAWGLMRDTKAPTSIPIDYLVYAVDADEDWKQAWAETERLIVATRDLSRELGAEYLLASASTPQGVLGADAGLAKLLEVYPAMRDQRWDLDLPDSRMAALSARNGVPFRALEPAFRKEQATGRILHWPFDGHWNPEGNDFAGERLAAFVLEPRPPRARAGEGR